MRDRFATPESRERTATGWGGGVQDTPLGKSTTTTRLRTRPPALP